MKAPGHAAVVRHEGGSSIENKRGAVMATGSAGMPTPVGAGPKGGGPAIDGYRLFRMPRLRGETRHICGNAICFGRAVGEDNPQRYLLRLLAAFARKISCEPDTARMFAIEFQSQVAHRLESCFPDGDPGARLYFVAVVRCRVNGDRPFGRNGHRRNFCCLPDRCGTDA